MPAASSARRCARSCIRLRSVVARRSSRLHATLPPASVMRASFSARFAAASAASLGSRAAT